MGEELALAFLLFLFLSGVLLFFVRGRFGLLLLLLAGLRAEQVLQKGEGRGAAGGEPVLPVLARQAHQFAQLLIHLLHVVVGDAELLQHIVDRFDAQLLGADQAEAVVDRLLPLHAGDKDDRRPFFTA